MIFYGMLVTFYYSTRVLSEIISRNLLLAPLKTKQLLELEKICLF